MIRLALVACLSLTFGGCAGVAAYLDAVNGPSDQQRCEDGGGQYRVIVRRDAATGVATETGECVTVPARRP